MAPWCCLKVVTTLPKNVISFFNMAARGASWRHTTISKPDGNTSARRRPVPTALRPVFKAFYKHRTIADCPEKTKTFKRKTDVKDWATKTETALKTIRDFPERNAGKGTLKDAITKYEKEFLGNKPDSKDKQKKQLSWWEKMIGHVRLANLTHQIICDARSVLLPSMTRTGKPRSTATVKRYMSALSTALTATVSR